MVVPVVVGGGEILVVIVDTEAGHISKALIIIACIWVNMIGIVVSLLIRGF